MSQPYDSGGRARALEFACGTTIGDARRVDHERARSAPAERYPNAAISRLACVEANDANSPRGLFRCLVAKPAYDFLKRAPAFVLRNAIGPPLADDCLTKPCGMARLRRKVEADPARPRHRLTEQGVGRRFAVEEEGA